MSIAEKQAERLKCEPGGFLKEQEAESCLPGEYDDHPVDALHIVDHILCFLQEAMIPLEAPAGHELQLSEEGLTGLNVILDDVRQRIRYCCKNLGDNSC